jgi:hypothetical protein
MDRKRTSSRGIDNVRFSFPDLALPDSRQTLRLAASCTESIAGSIDEAGFRVQFLYTVHPNIHFVQAQTIPCRASAGRDSSNPLIVSNARGNRR